MPVKTNTAARLYLGNGESVQLPGGGLPDAGKLVRVNSDGTSTLIDVPTGATSAGASGAIQTSDGASGFADSGVSASSGDLVASTAEFRNGLTYGEASVFGTYTASDDHERARVYFNGTNFVIATEAGASGGTVQNLELQVGTDRLCLKKDYSGGAIGISTNSRSNAYSFHDGYPTIYSNTATRQWQFNNATFRPMANNTYDIGQNALRVKTGYFVGGDFSGDVTVGGNITADSLPTSDPAVSGQLWNDSGTVKVSAG